MMTDMTLRGMIMASDEELQDHALDRAETVLPHLMRLEREGFTRDQIESYTHSTGVTLEELASDVKNGLVSASDFALQQEEGYDTMHWGRDLDAFRETREQQIHERNRRYVGAALTAGIGLISIGGVGAVSGVLAPGDALAASPCNAYINITVDDGVSPIDNASVRYIMNPGTAMADTLTGNTDEFGELELSTDVISAVGDLPSRFAVDNPFPNPTGSVSQFHMSTSPEKGGEKTLVEGFDLRGRRVFSGYAQDGEIRPSETLADGNYLVRFSQGGEQITKKISVIGGLDKIVVSQSSGMNKVWTPGPDPADVLIQADGFDILTEEGVLVYEGDNFHDYALDAESGHPLLFKVVDGSGDNFLSGVTVKLIGPDMVEYADTSDVSGQANIILPSSYALTDSFALHIDDTPELTHNVYAIGKWGVPTCVGRITSTDGPYCVNQDVAKATIDDMILTNNPEGLWLATWNDTYVESQEWRDMVADYYERVGALPYGAGDTLTLVNFQSIFPTGGDANTGHLQLHQNLINYALTELTRETGINIVEGSQTEMTTLPPIPDGNAFIRQATFGPGNARGPPGQDHWLYLTVDTPLGTPYSTMVLELFRSLGVQEGREGTNGNGFEYVSPSSVILNDLGEKSLFYFWTHNYHDGKF